MAGPDPRGGGTDRLSLLNGTLNDNENEPVFNEGNTKGFGECGLCFEENKFINNVIIPCGHNGYCITCLKTIKK